MLLELHRFPEPKVWCAFALWSPNEYNRGELWPHYRGQIQVGHARITLIVLDVAVDVDAMTSIETVRRTPVLVTSALTLTVFAFVRGTLSSTCIQPHRNLTGIYDQKYHTLTSGN